MSGPAAEDGKHPPQPSKDHVEPGPDAAALACDSLRRDHRQMEEYLDRLLEVLQHLSAEQVAEVQSIVNRIQHLAAVHFEKEEKILYPRLRLIRPQLLDQMDGQHGMVREVEVGVNEMLANPPPEPGSRWLNELRRLGTEFHDHIQHHIVDEEDHLFRVAEGHLSLDEQTELAREMAAVEKRMIQNKGR